jgi:hypothetical protein
MGTKGLFARWLYLYDMNESRNRILLFGLAGCVLMAWATLAGLSEVQRLIADTANIRNMPAGLERPFSVSRYSLEQRYSFWVDGVKFQFWITLGLIVRLAATWTYKCTDRFSERRWLGVLIAHFGLLTSVVAFVWYNLISYRILFRDGDCAECVQSYQYLVGASPLWALVITVVVLLHFLFDLSRFLVPLAASFREGQLRQRSEQD